MLKDIIGFFVDIINITLTLLVMGAILFFIFVVCNPVAWLGLAIIKFLLKP